MRLIHEAVEVGGSAEQWIDGCVVADVIPDVPPRRRVDRREPDRIDPQVDEIVELAGDARQVAGAVAIAVGEAPRVDLVDDAVAPPVVAEGRVLDGTRVGPRRVGHRPSLAAHRSIYSPAMSDGTTIHLVPHTHWDREWYQPFQTFRMRLVDLI